LPPRTGNAADARPQPDPESWEWRRRRLLRAGVSSESADEVARDQRFDLHTLLVLMDRGCDPQLAVRILAPLEEDPERW